jgi:alkanesulfonate monooxygenase SsuD/methylene tetrahydromethanopterin reductase-like flavin-dependent oxidoreductase (luciferase family)
MNIRLGISFDGFIPYPESVDLARRAVEAGASSLWMAEHLGYREALVTSMGFLTATPDAVVVPTAVSPYLWHPTPTAMALATLAEAAPGRVAVAVGLGNPLFLRESGVEPVKPVRAMREYIDSLRSLWAGEPVRHQDALLHPLAGARMGFKPPQPIPIYVAAMREQMLGLTGRIADGVVLSGGLSVDYVRRSLGLCEAAAAKAGRDLKGFRKSGYVFFGVSRDRREAFDVLREKISFVMRNEAIRENIVHSGVAVDHDGVVAAIAERDFAAAASLISDDAVRAFSIGGTPTDCAEGIRAYAEAGLEELVLLVSGTEENQQLALDVISEFLEQ